MNKALDAVNSLSKTLTKSVKIRTIKNSRALTIQENISSKSSEGNVIDTVAYIFNFDNNEGFAIVVADQRVPEQILACTEDGNIGLESTNPGLAIFLEKAEEYIAESIEKSEAEKDSLSQTIIDKLIAENPELADDVSTKASFTSLFPFEVSITNKFYAWEFDSNIAPLTAVEWDQISPYNKFTKAKGCGGNAPYTGCVAVATSQILAYWKYPSSIDGFTMNWAEMTRYTSDFSRNNLFNNKWTGSIYGWGVPTTVLDNIARVMERVGVNVGMQYGCSSSSAASGDAVNWLKRVGFSGGEKSNYDFSRIKNSLDEKRMVFARGSSSRTRYRFLGITFYETFDGGHAWNYDGYIQQKQKFEHTITIINKKTKQVLSKSNLTLYKYQNFVHVNWGWGGFDNGYYASGAFNSNNEPISSGTKSSSDEGTDGNFQYNLEIFTNLRR